MEAKARRDSARTNWNRREQGNGPPRLIATMISTSGSTRVIGPQAHPKEEEQSLMKNELEAADWAMI